MYTTATLLEERLVTAKRARRALQGLGVVVTKLGRPVGTTLCALAVALA